MADDETGHIGSGGDRRIGAVIAPIPPWMWTQTELVRVLTGESGTSTACSAEVATERMAVWRSRRRSLSVGCVSSSAV